VVVSPLVCTSATECQPPFVFVGPITPIAGAIPVIPIVSVFAPVRCGLSGAPLGCGVDGVGDAHAIAVSATSRAIPQPARCAVGLSRTIDQPPN
jgi:hypothetical protein